MKDQSLYTIEFYMEHPVDRWQAMPSFSHMRKSFAEGAWAMLRAHYNHNRRHRLVRNGEVIAELSRQIVRLA